MRDFFIETSRRCKCHDITLLTEVIFRLSVFELRFLAKTRIRDRTDDRVVPVDARRTEEYPSIARRLGKLQHVVAFAQIHNTRIVDLALQTRNAIR